MDTNQQPKAAYLAQELKAGEWAPNILQNEVALRQCAAEELLRLHAENETLRAGYVDARVELEYLQLQFAAIGAGGVEPLRKTDTAARGTDAQIIKERELCAYAFAGAIADGLSGGTGPDSQESEWLRPAFEAGQEIAQLRAEIDQLRKRECLHQISEPAAPLADAPVARHALQRDELLQVALDFIGTLTGMHPPPIETAPPEVFAPFYAFVDRVQAITAPQVQADAQDAVTQAVRDYHFALDTRQHGEVAAGKALDAIQQAIGLKWVQGAEASARAAIAAAQRAAAQKDE